MNIRLLLTATLFLAGCTQAPESLTLQQAVESPAVTPSTVPYESAIASSSPDASPSASPTAENPPLISSQGIGAAQLGMRYGDLKQALGSQAEFVVTSSFMTDFDAIAVTQNGQVQFYVLYLSGHTFTDNDVIQGLLTDNPTYKTVEGVGPASSIRDAEMVYGNATLSYSTANESREYVRFERQPSSNLSFGTGNANQGAVGIYPSALGDYNETQQFKEGAAIKSVLVVCLTGACAN